MKFTLETRPDNEKFLMAALALGVICSIQGEENQHSARWNRTRAAEEAILRVCDTYLPNGIDKIKLSKLWEVIDGPVMAVIRKYKHSFDGLEDGTAPTKVVRCPTTGRFRKIGATIEAGIEV